MGHFGQTSRDHSDQRTAIVRDALGIGIASGAYALSFGAISSAAGLSLPIALLAALIATQTFSTGSHLVIDVRAAALALAAVAVVLRAPFLVVVAAGAATAALLRLL